MRRIEGGGLGALRGRMAAVIVIMCNRVEKVIPPQWG